jgi:hypothetical protein
MLRELKPQALSLVIPCSLIHFEYQSIKLMFVCTGFYFRKDYKNYSRFHKNMWHVDPLLGSDREISSYTRAVVSKLLCKQRPFLHNGRSLHARNNRRTVGSGVFYAVLA